MEAASNFWARWSWQDDSSCCSSSVLARPERCTFWNIFLNNRCQELKWTRIIWVCFLVHVLIRKLLKRLILLWTSEYINVDSSKYLISQARLPRLDWWERSLLRRVVAERPSTMPSPSAMFTVRISYWCLWVKPEILHSELYDADAVDPKICLELGCKVGGFCRCAEYLYLLLHVHWRLWVHCRVPRLRLHSPAAPHWEDLLQLRVSFPHDIGEVFKFEIVHRSVKIVASKMISLDNASSSSSATVGSSSSEDEIFELY